MKKYLVATSFLVLGVVLFLIYNLVGSSVGADGILVEPAFFCLPLGFLSVLIGLVLFLITFLKKSQS
ncbi:MAG: DUF3955 domain-containing protein [Enterococcus sp.]